MSELIARPQFEAFAKVLEDAGIDARAPWECSLDDREQERFDTFQKAIAAALAAQQDLARESAIEQCAKLMETIATDWDQVGDRDMASEARKHASMIRVLGGAEQGSRET